MGRTNPTYRDELRKMEDQWQRFRRGLRHQDQEHFDQLFEHGRAYADAACYQNATYDVIAFLISVCLAQQRQLADFDQRLEAIEAELEPDK